jgi:CheY-like chemotaxis protein
MLAAETWYEIVLPPLVTLGAVVVGVTLLWLAHRKIAEFASQTGIQHVSAFGVDVQFAEEQATAAYRKQGLGPPSETDKATIREAADHLAPLAVLGRVLWVDDNPAGNALERSTFVSWEIDVQAARTTDEAVAELKANSRAFDVVISDWRRKGDSPAKPAGVDLLRRVKDLPDRPPIIFYHGPVDASELAGRRETARKEGAVGATGSPGELFRWTLLELARAALEHPREAQVRRREGLRAARAQQGSPEVLTAR